MSEDNESFEDFSLDSLKNQENVKKNIEFELLENNDETHLDYKKKLNKKVSDFSEEEKKIYNKLAQKNKRKNDKNDEEVQQKSEDEKVALKSQSNLYNQLFVLKKKFPDFTEDIHIDSDMNMTTLEEKKDLIMKIITQKNSDSIIFETLLLASRTAERGLNYCNVEALDGYSDNLNESREDIIPILKEMIDLGEIDTTMMTPQLRLMIVMSSVAVKTIEKNNDKKNSQRLVAPVDTS